MVSWGAMATLTAFLQHSYIGKQSQAAPYTAGAHARYIMRKQAASLIYSENMPRQYHAVQRFLAGHENGLRRNGRVLDKFIISVPRGISEQHAAKALKKFGYRLGQGRTPFLFSLHGADTKNFHAHFIFLDRDIETGKRVFGTTLRNSTSAIKVEWETAANETFAELGYDLRVQVKETLRTSNDNDAEAPEQASDVETPPATVSEDAQPGEDTMPTIERMPENETSLAGTDVRLLASTVRELNWLRDSRVKIQEAKERHEWLVAEREKLGAEAGKYESDSLKTLMDSYAANEELARHQNAHGQLKGLELNLLGWQFKSGARKRAEYALAVAESRQRDADVINRARSRYRHEMASLDNQKETVVQGAIDRENHLRALYGDEPELDAAEKDFDQTVKRIIQDVDPENARNAYDDGEINASEYRTFLEQGGHSGILVEFNEELGQSEDGGASL